MMIESPFFTATQSSFDEDSIDISCSNFGQNNYNFNLNSSSFHTRNAQNSDPTLFSESIDTHGNNFYSNTKPVVDQFLQTNDVGPMPFQPPAEAGLHGSSDFPGYAEEYDPEFVNEQFDTNPAPPVTLRPPISTYSPVQYSSTPPIIEYPDSDIEEFSTSISPYSNALNQIDIPVQNVNINFEYNEATLNTVANVMNHDVHVEEHLIDTTAHVVHHNVEVDELVHNSIATVENHFVDVDEQTHRTTANVTHHEVEVEENLISTIANVESNLVEVKTKTLKSIANVEDHELDIRKNTIKSVANVDNHKLKVNTNTVESIANVDNHEVKVQNNNYVTTANVDNHNVLIQKHNYSSIADVECHFLDIQKKDIKSTANVDNHYIAVHSNDTKSIANVENHYIDVRKNDTKSIANVENHYIEVHKNDTNSIANVENHYIEVRKNDSNSIANVDNHYIDVHTNDNRSIANVDNHYVDIIRNDKSTVANVDNHYVEVYENEQRSIARVDNHLVQVEERTQNSLARVQHHNVNVVNELCSSTALVQSNRINVNEMTLTSTANIYSNNIEVNHKIIPSTAEVQNHKINVVEKTLESTISVPKFVVNVQEKEVPINISTENISMQILNGILQLANANANAKQSLVPSANDRSSISTQANLLDDSHRELVASDSHLVHSSENALPYSHSPMETTTKSYSPSCSIVDAGDSEGQNSYPSQVISDLEDEDRSRNHDTSSSSQSQASEQVSDSDQRDNDSDSGSERNNQRDSNRENNRPPVDHSTSTDDAGQFTPESLQRELSSVSSYDDLRRVRSKWNHKLVDAHQWGSNVDVIDNPIMWNVVISSEWPGVGRFVCPECLVHADDVHANIRLHLDHEHHTVPIDALHNATIARISGRSHLWRLSKEGSEDVVIESVYICTHEGCNYFTNIRRNYLSHLRSHAQLNDLVQKLGIFWGSIVDRAKSGNMLKASDIFHERVGYGCPLCDDYISSSKNNFSSHVSSKHSETRIEGAQRPSPIQIRLIPLINSEIDEVPPGIEFVRMNQRRGPRNPTATHVDTREASASSRNSQASQLPSSHNSQNSQLDNSQSSQISQSDNLHSTQSTQIPQSDNSQSSQVSQIPQSDNSQSSQVSQSSQSANSQSSHNQQNSQSANLQSTQLQNSQATQLDDQRLRDIIDVLSLGSANNTHGNNSNFRNHVGNSISNISNNNNSNNNNVNTHYRSNDSHNNIRLPDISDSDEEAITPGTDSIASATQGVEMEEEVEFIYNKEEMKRKAIKWLRNCETEELDGISLPRLKEYHRKRVLQPIKNLFDTKVSTLIKYIKTHNCDEDDWLITEGILARISLLIRKCIRTALRIPINNTKKKKVRNRDLEYNRSTLAVKKIFELTELCDLLERLNDKGNARDTAANRNSIANLEKRIVDCIQQTDTGIVHYLFGGNTLSNVRRFLNDSHEHRDAKLEWLRCRIIKEEKNYEMLRGRRHEKTIREFYHEDARRCAEWFIYGSVSPECKVPLNDFERHFRNEWKRSEDYDRNSPALTLDPTVDPESQEWMLKKLSDIEAIGKVIRSKANMSAAGPDAISNVIWKSNVQITSKLISRLMKAMLASGKSPSAWKRSRTIMIYKKGPSDNVKSWRPISLTPTLYRIVMGHVSNVVQELNARNPILCRAQKGFVANVNGCAEHICVLNELISHATRNKKDINVVTLDFANAFGSVDHRQIVDSLKCLGFPQPFVKWIKDLYKDNATSISVDGEYSSMIPMERGVRQGCPFSPFLFNICLEPLLRDFLLNHVADGYKVGDISFNVQAFADDVVLISHSTEQMSNMLQTVENFCSATGMKLTGSKCNWFSYIMSNNNRVSSSNSLTINGEEIHPITITDCIKYLGAPIAANRNAKMKFSEDLLIKVKHQVNQLLLSPLTLSQSLDAIRKLIMPQLDFIFMNGVVSLSYAKKLDENIRGLIQKKIKSPGLPIEVVHCHWKDGGMNIPRLEHRLELLQIHSFLNLLTCKDDRVRYLINFNIIDEANKRHIERSDVNSFIGFSKASLGPTNDVKTNTSFTRALKAADKLDISITVENEDFDNMESSSLINNSPIPTFRLATSLDDENKIINAKSFLPTMNKLLEERYCSELSSKEFRCHSFDSLKDSKLSNFFIGNCKTPTSDNLVKFAFQARTNSLLTEEVERKRNLNQSDKCRACGGYATGSLMHRLNKCQASMVRITARHNAIARVISDGLRNMLQFNCPPLNENSTIFLRDVDPLPEQTRFLKPDIWFIEENAQTHKRTINIIEITCPYGMLTDTAQGRKSSLEVREKEKMDKYNKLIDDIKVTWNIDATLYVIVISSLGAITKNTEQTLKKLFHTKKRSSLIAKRCVIAAIRGSWAIFYGKDIGACTHNNDHNSTSSSHLTDEEDGDILNDEN